MPNLQEMDYLHTSLENCAICGVPCTSSCGACKKVGYCSKAHQQNHWKSHKLQCFPLVVQQNDVLGRYLVTTRDVKQGEVILKETPIFSGPHLGDASAVESWTTIVCLSCFRIVPTNYKCSKCHWPLCGVTCEKDEQHAQSECKIFAERNITPDTFFETTPDYFVYEGVTVLRGVLQKAQNPAKWSKILELQSHGEERSRVEHARQQKNSAIRFVRQVCGQSQCQEEEIDHVLGAIGVNAFVSDDGVSQAQLYRNGTYLYHIASMPAHNCVPNSSWIIQLNSDFHLRAAVPIKTGESVNFLYTEATLPTSERRRKLKDNKYFLCGCPRCMDSSELGTYFSSPKCTEKNCTDGNLLPTYNLQTMDVSWCCELCSSKKSPEFVHSLLAKVDKETSLVDQDDSFSSIEKLIKIINKYSGVVLHPNNFKIHDIENDVLQRVSFLLMQHSRARKNQFGSNEIKWATKLVELSRKSLSISDKIWPGFNRHRGRLLYFLQQGLTIKMSVAVSNKKSKGKSLQDLSLLKQDLQEIQRIRQEVLGIFSIEPEGREESYIAKAMKDDSPEMLHLNSLLLQQ
ncbi:SET domain-containing protein SmydA-8 [Folsomia candida]|uniref:SET domain-containing protein SmydA-8 n=1 Tax=Folsomia candida TaxID=158441 RepID=UPI001605362F|nr:SET domain-containing protein SmydA-8 [Folsomia candida]